ncbi:hypothetical protein BG000_001137 [Podila horticola]|nr:hypothetical protein BG000_001137 [Podila horticola]
MFDITELDDMVCALLDRTSLARCAQASRKWNKVFAPYIWKTIPKSMTNNGWNTFRQHVLEDCQQEKYLQEQQRLQDQSPPAKKARKSIHVAKPMYQSSESSQIVQPLALTKYGQLIRVVEGFAELLVGLAPESADGGRSRSRKYSDPSARDLARHFLKRCPNALLNFEVDYEHIQSTTMFSLVLEALPRVKVLVLKGRNDGRQAFPIKKFKQILIAVSDRLDSLAVDIPRFRADTRDNTIGITSSLLEPEITARPKRFKLSGPTYVQSAPVDWTWIWRACGQVEEIEIGYVMNGFLANITRVIRDSMPCVDTVTFGRYFPSPSQQNIASVLAANTKGWKSVRCDSTCGWMASYAFDVLLDSASTLEELTVTKIEGGTGIPRILKLCSRLRKLVTIDNGYYSQDSFPAIAAKDLIDWDPELMAIRPWPCQATLETLAIKISGVPQRDTLASDEHPTGHRRFLETQQRVSEKLGQLTNLRFLQLGHTATILGYGSIGHVRRGKYTVAKQGMCAHLTLETGLDKLAGLKKLEELHIPNMEHQVNEVPEVEWMVQNWPMLSKLVGLNPSSRAYKWLNANHPEIQLE